MVSPVDIGQSFRYWSVLQILVGPADIGQSLRYWSVLKMLVSPVRVKLTPGVLDYFDKYKRCLLMLVDLSAAFNTVDQEILDRRLEETFGLSETRFNDSNSVSEIEFISENRSF